MRDPESFFLEDKFNFNSRRSEEALSNSFLAFCEKAGEAFEIKDFLITLKAQIPKKLKAGELALFYECGRLGLRRAYIRGGAFYEEEAQQIWPLPKNLRAGRPEENAYLAQEQGRPFFKTLLAPLPGGEALRPSLLFIEISRLGAEGESLEAFFKERELILNLIFKRAASNSHLSGISQLWSRLFENWKEPLAIIQGRKAARGNEAFKKLMSVKPDFLNKAELSGAAEIGKKIYQVCCFPISQIKSPQPLSFLYCHDMTKPFLLRGRLFQSEKMAAISKLGKNIAHRLNNPLTGLRSMAQILRRDPKLREFKEELEELEKAAARSQKIIESLLSFSQNRKGQSCFSLNQITESVLPLLKSLTKDLKIELNPAREPLEIYGDFSLLQLAVYNIILNSCQALREDKNNKEPCIQISAERDGGGFARLTIRDNGPGISKSHLEKIFQALWTSKKSRGGTGLGLKISQQIVKKLGGEILASSEEGRFACFSIILPLKKEKKAFPPAAKGLAFE